VDGRLARFVTRGTVPRMETAIIVAFVENPDLALSARTESAWVSSPEASDRSEPQ
jgi:hypothetical protein